MNRHNMIGKMLADVDPLGLISKDGSTGTSTGKINKNCNSKLFKTCSCMYALTDDCTVECEGNEKEDMNGEDKS